HFQKRQRGGNVGGIVHVFQAGENLSSHNRSALIADSFVHTPKKFFQFVWGFCLAVRVAGNKSGNQPSGERGRGNILWVRRRFRVVLLSAFMKRGGYDDVTPIRTHVQASS